MADFVTTLISGAAGLGAGFLGGWLTNRREREKRRTDHIERQLSELYGPLMTLSKQIAARRDHRADIETTVDKVWERLAPEMRKVGASDQTISELLSSQRDRLTDDDKKHLEEVMLPDFREMLRLFREKMWLVEPNSVPHFETIVKYIDTWELSLRGVIRGSVTIELLRPLDAKLRQFYSDLEATYDRLRRERTAVQKRKGWPITIPGRPRAGVSTVFPGCGITGGKYQRRNLEIKSAQERAFPGLT